MSALAPVTRVPLLGRARGNLRSSLVSYWRCDEDSGTLVDALGRNHLTAVNAPTSAPGRVGTAREFNGTTQYFTTPDNPSLSMGDIDFAIASWVNPSIVDAADILSKWAGPDNEFALRLQPDNQTILFVSSTGADLTLLPGGYAPASTWSLIFAWYDATARTINLQVNNGAVASTPHSGGAFNGSSPFTIGKSTTGVASWDGKVDEVCIWKGYIPSPAERTLLWNNGAGLTYPFVPSPAASLFQGLVSYWSLDEASGPALDSHANNHLTAVNGPVSAPGRVGNARQFVAASSQYLEIASNPSLQMGPTDVTFACWVYLDDLAAAYVLFGKAATGTPEYALTFNAPPAWIWNFSYNFIDYYSTGTTVVAPATAGSWHFLVVTIDVVAGETRIQVDNGPILPIPQAYYGSAGTAPFRIGSQALGPQFLNGRIDELGFWKRCLTTTERAALWNLGAGTTYPFTGISTTPDPLLGGLVSFWNLDEEGGNAADSHGVNHLTQVNSPTSAPGKVGTARQLTAVSVQALRLSPPASLGFNGQDMTFACWVRFDSLSTFRVFLSQWHNSAQHGYLLYYRAPATAISFVLYPQAGGAGGAILDWPGSPSTGTWYFVVAWYDHATQTTWLQVNNGTPVSAAVAGPIGAPITYDFHLGMTADGQVPHDGQIDEVGFWRRVLSDVERSALWNGGAGRTYPFVGVS